MGWLTTDGHIEVCQPDQTYPQRRLIWLWVYGRRPEPAGEQKRSENINAGS